MTKAKELRKLRKQYKVASQLCQAYAVLLNSWEKSRLFRIWKLIHRRRIAAFKQRVKELKNQ
jgi:putative intracellular protease/amidase